MAFTGQSQFARAMSGQQFTPYGGMGEANVEMPSAVGAARGPFDPSTPTTNFGASALHGSAERNTCLVRYYSYYICIRSHEQL